MFDMVRMDTWVRIILGVGELAGRRYTCCDLSKEAKNHLQVCPPTDHHDFSGRPKRAPNLLHCLLSPI